MARRGAGADLRLDLLVEIASSSVDAGRKPHEQHDAHVAVEILADAQRLDDLRHLLDLVVDLGGADAHAAGIERRVRAAMDDHAAMRRPFGEVAMAPDIVETLEIGGAIFDAVRIVPEATGIEGNGLVQTSSPFSSRIGLPSSSQTSTAMPSPAPGFRRSTQVLSDMPSTKQPHDIGAAGDGGQVHIRLDAGIDEGKAFRRKRRTGRGNRAHSRKIVRSDRPQAALAQRVDEFRRGAEIGHLFGLRIVEQHVAVRIEGRAVVKQQRRAACQPEPASSTSSSRRW
jgi:hypothetical protein